MFLVSCNQATGEPERQRSSFIGTWECSYVWINILDENDIANVTLQYEFINTNKVIKRSKSLEKTGGTWILENFDYEINENSDKIKFLFTETNEIAELDFLFNSATQLTLGKYSFQKK